MPETLLTHIWRGVQKAKAARFRATVGRLIQELSDILRADFNRSDAGRSAQNLKASIGEQHAEMFDFGVMSRLLTKAEPEATLPEGRRTRIARAVVGSRVAALLFGSSAFGQGRGGVPVRLPELRGRALGLSPALAAVARRRPGHRRGGARGRR